MGDQPTNRGGEDAENLLCHLMGIAPQSSVFKGLQQQLQAGEPLKLRPAAPIIPAVPVHTLPVQTKTPHLVASLPWKRLWPVLEAKGWRVTTGKKQSLRQFYPPSARLDTATGTPAKCFNSMKSVRAHLRETVPDPVAFLAALPPGKDAECTYKNAEYTAPTIRPSYGGTDSTGHGYIGELDGRNHITMPGDSRPGKQRILSSSSPFHTGMKIFPPQGKPPHGQPPGMHVVPAGISQPQWDRLRQPQGHHSAPIGELLGQPRAPPGDPLAAGCEGGVQSTVAGELDADDVDQNQNEMDSNDNHDDDHEDDKTVPGRMKPRNEAKGALNMMCTT